MSKVIGFEAWETIMISLINVTQCPECQVLINYNGLPPRRCPQCHEIMSKPVTPAGGSHGEGTSISKAPGSSG